MEQDIIFHLKNALKEDIGTGDHTSIACIPENNKGQVKLVAKENGIIEITDERMTRFMISLDQAVKLVWHTFEDMIGGEIYVKKIPSMNIMDIADAIAPGREKKIIGILQ